MGTMLIERNDKKGPSPQTMAVSHVSPARHAHGSLSQGSWKCWSHWQEVLPVGPHEPCAHLAVPVAELPAQLLPVMRQNDLNKFHRDKWDSWEGATPPVSRFPG